MPQSTAVDIVIWPRTRTVCQLAHRKHRTVKIKDFTYVLKYLKDGKDPKIVQKYASTTEMFYHRQAVHSSQIIAHNRDWVFPTVSRPFWYAQKRFADGDTVS